MYNFPFYPHFPTKSYRDYPHNINSNIYQSAHSPINKNVNFKNSSSPAPNISSLNHTNSYNKNQRNYRNGRISSSFKEKVVKPNTDNIKKNTQENTLENKGDFFEILGIKLYSDDIILIFLIFFLYKEGVQDEYLFISLIMLLLS